jgi:hypothetical protein
MLQMPVQNDKSCVTTCGATIQGFGMASPGTIARRLGSIAGATPTVFAIAAGVACTIATDGACAPLAYAAFASSVAMAARDDGIVGGGRANKGRFAADVAIAGALYGFGKVAEAASSPFYTRSVGDQRQLRGLANTVTFMLDLFQHRVR